MLCIWSSGAANNNEDKIYLYALRCDGCKIDNFYYLSVDLNRKITIGCGGKGFAMENVEIEFFFDIFFYFFLHKSLFRLKIQLPDCINRNSTDFLVNLKTAITEMGIKKISKISIECYESKFRTNIKTSSMLEFRKIPFSHLLLELTFADGFW